MDTKDEVIKYLLYYIDLLDIQLNYEYGNIEDDIFREITEKYVTGYPKVSKEAKQILEDNFVFMG